MLVKENGTSRNTCSFIVGVKNGLRAGGYMNSTDTNQGSWRDSRRRGWCNGGFRSAINSDLRAAFKKFNCLTGTPNRTGGSNITTQDYFALFAEKEIFGFRTYSTNNEADALTRITWYTPTSNRIKTQGDSGDVYYWWERSPLYSGTYSFCSVAGRGDAYVQGASNPDCLSPFGCI